jgi:hypothetical protein
MTDPNFVGGFYDLLRRLRTALQQTMLISPLSRFSFTCVVKPFCTLLSGIILVQTRIRPD